MVLGTLIKLGATESEFLEKFFAPIIVEMGQK